MKVEGIVLYDPIAELKTIMSKNHKSDRDTLEPIKLEINNNVVQLHFAGIDADKYGTQSNVSITIKLNDEDEMLYHIELVPEMVPKLQVVSLNDPLVYGKDLTKIVSLNSAFIEVADDMTDHPILICNFVVREESLREFVGTNMVVAV